MCVLFLQSLESITLALAYLFGDLAYFLSPKVQLVSASDPLFSVFGEIAANMASKLFEHINYTISQLASLL